MTNKCKLLEDTLQNETLLQEIKDASKEEVAPVSAEDMIRKIREMSNNG